MISVYVMITSKAMGVVSDMYSVLFFCPGLGSEDSLIIMHSLWGEEERMIFLSLLSSSSPSGLLQQLLRILNSLWG